MTSIRFSLATLVDWAALSPTGSTWAYVPNDVAEDVRRALAAQGPFVGLMLVDCLSSAELPCSPETGFVRCARLRLEFRGGTAQRLAALRLLTRHTAAAGGSVFRLGALKAPFLLTQLDAPARPVAV
ncbi:hypothetical protein OAX78_00410 [Planctomycetota bacterium]|nr:hypothetical protein [Planctomycetota bacterium]